MKKILAPAKNYVVKHRVGLLASATVALATVVTVQQLGIQQHNTFLKDKGLFDEFYAVNE